MTLKHLCLAALMFVSAVAESQTVPYDSTAKPAEKPAAKAPATPAIDFSGIVFANYQYRGEQAARSANKFDVERAYLTFRMPAGERTSVRITTDLYQQTTSGSDSYYRGWSLRAKYAYLQYNYLTGPEWRATARIGLLHNVFIEHDEAYWPRWLGTSPTDRAGFFSSADAGLATSVTLPRKLGEVYATVVNGPGYTSRETDRFKDVGARVTLSPWARDASSPVKTLVMTAWGYKGAVASKFVSGGTGQLGTVGDGLDRDRWGLHVGSLTPRLTIAAQYAARIDEGESGLNTSVSPRAIIDSTGTLASAYALVRPFPTRETKPHPLSLLARFDRVTTNTDSGDKYDFVIGGLVWDFSSKASISLDYQEATSREGTPVAPTRTWFAHFVARF